MKNIRPGKIFPIPKDFHKPILIMKLSFIISIVTILQVTASVYSQNLSIDAKNETIREVIKTLESESGYRFFYNAELTGLDNTISIKSKNNTISALLDKVFANQQFSYKILANRMVVIAPRELFQPPKITGVVTDENGQPLPGVTVMEKGTSNGTITNDKGEYTISVSAPDAVLVFSFIGMKAQELPIDNKTIIDISLNTEAIGLNEVVAVGYGTVKKSDLTGSVSSVNSEELNAFPSTDLNKALQGRAAGVQITSVNGAPGDGVRIRIRGGTSINASNQPLYVVDGFAGAMLPQAEDVKSVENTQRCFCNRHLWFERCQRCNSHYNEKRSSR